MSKAIKGSNEIDNAFTEITGALVAISANGNLKNIDFGALSGFQNELSDIVREVEIHTASKFIQSSTRRDELLVCEIPTLNRIYGEATIQAVFKHADKKYLPEGVVSTPTLSAATRNALKQLSQ
jgi:hypothetical protein